MGGSWLSLHIWEHYLYTGDVDFLREYYPIMKGSARFLLDVMAVEPEHNWLVVPFSMSPEQGYFVDDSGEEMFLSSSTTMNSGIIRDLFAGRTRRAGFWMSTRNFAKLAGASEEDTTVPDRRRRIAPGVDRELEKG
jgi:alpha-L-fucosidase 2